MHSTFYACSSIFRYIFYRDFWISVCWYDSLYFSLFVSFILTVRPRFLIRSNATYHCVSCQNRKTMFVFQSTEHFLHKQTRVDHDIVMFWWWRSSPFGLLSASPLCLCCDITVLSTLNKYHSCFCACACVRKEAKKKTNLQSVRLYFNMLAH